MHNGIAPEYYEKIMEQLSLLEREHKITIIFAVESGSRAWGFPSPDSDYDVRFIYSRPVEDYLSLKPIRDVVELPIDDLLDINGWDIKKALGLMLKSNPVLLEWLQSPIRYIWDEGVCGQMLELSQKTAYEISSMHHYLKMGQRQRKEYIEGKTSVKLKKYFYVVRPAMVLRWLRLKPESIPPMNFFDLRDGIELPAELNEELDKLLEKKSKTKEMGMSEPIEIINKFLDEELNWAEREIKNVEKQKQNLDSEANVLFRQLITSGY